MVFCRISWSSSAYWCASMFRMPTIFGHSLGRRLGPQPLRADAGHGVKRDLEPMRHRVTDQCIIQPATLQVRSQHPQVFLSIIEMLRVAPPLSDHSGSASASAAGATCGLSIRAGTTSTRRFSNAAKSASSDTRSIRSAPGSRSTSRSTSLSSPSCAPQNTAEHPNVGGLVSLSQRDDLFPVLVQQRPQRRPGPETPRTVDPDQPGDLGLAPADRRGDLGLRQSVVGRASDRRAQGFARLRALAVGDCGNPSQRLKHLRTVQQIAHTITPGAKAIWRFVCRGRRPG